MTGAAQVVGDEGDGEIGAWELIGIGSFAVGSVVAGLVIGGLADNRWDSSPVGILIGLTLGIVGAVVGSWVRIARYLRR